MSSHNGHCRCEGVVISVQGEPEFSVYCHCDDCRRSSGAPVIAAAGFPTSAVSWKSKNTLESWKNGTCTRTFCKVCGSPVTQQHESAPDHIFFYTAFMEDPEKFPPTYHSFGGAQINWLKLKDDLPRYERTKIIKA